MGDEHLDTIPETESDEVIKSSVKDLVPIPKTRSGSTTTHVENSLPEYDSFHFEIESDQGELSRVVMETIDEIDAFLDIDISTDLEDG
ncbi:hypothetical protein Tco_0297441, partial [Tanacetum coccineum]